MAHMNRIIHAQPDGQHDGYARDDVDGHVPEVQEADNIGEGEEHAGKGHGADLDVGKEDQGDDGYDHQSKANVAHQFEAYVD